MSRLSELKEKKKLDNNGFSLVELIIVIAIMAVLIGVLAPQYLKYVEKSRVSADLDSIDSMVNAISIYLADPANSVITGSLECSASGTITANPSAALTDAGIQATPTLKSSTYGKKDWKIEFKSDGSLDFTGSSGATLKTAMGY